MKPILIVDDDPHMRSALNEAVQRLGYESITAENGQDALLRMNGRQFGMVITDMKMPRMNGLSFLKELKRRSKGLPVLIITGFGTVENAVETMKEGATDYLLKPFSFESLTTKIESIMKRIENERDIVTANDKMKRLLMLASDISGSDTTVLICGESGTGKEIFSRYIHRMSRRSDKPFIAVNCAAIPENLIESELFGFEKGAFTGASERKLGKFELANSGTILLDEIGEMPLNLQAKFLRVLQEREVDRVGGKEPVSVDVRVIATTNRDLYKETLEGRFREDLYYRLSVFPIHLPPLRERVEDIVLLAEHFLKKYAMSSGKSVKGMGKDAVDMLKNRQWRGNIRELENAVQRAILLCKGEMITREDFMIDRGMQSSVQASNGAIREMERELILKTLKESGGNKTIAAKMLGVSARTIRNKLNEYGKNFPDKEI